MSEKTVTTPQHTNALAQERSPYLLQHAHNPVNWLPWGAEAIQLARQQDKPIFLSSGYSTCHWCHVMERESFENEDTAKLLNENFISIKVDREERPDVDLTYMTYVQAASGSGGWPMSVFLTPELKPFYGGTYYPPENTPGRIGFKNLLTELAKIWKEDRKGIEERATRSVDKLQEHLDNENKEVTGLDPSAILQKAYDDLSSSFDYHEGGFGSAPKFPRPTSLNLLMRIHRAFACRKDSERDHESDWAMEMTAKTLRGMANGGMRDHIGGGFHRYSVDAYWHIPHYEKMLYDQAQLLTAYTEAWKLTQRNPLFESIARSTIDYLQRDLRHESGGFYSAEDADSLASAESDHKTEGAFYVWKATEIDELLGKENGSLFRYAYGARRDGNARPESDPHGELKGLNTLYRAVSIKKTAEYFNKTPEEVRAIIDEAILKLATARNQRPRPHRVEKVIASWNGLLISGLARTGAAFDDPKIIQLATQAAQFIHDQLCTTPGKNLHRSWCSGQRGPTAFAIDYACLIHGLLDLYEATFDVKWLQWAVSLQTEMDAQFLDTKNGGYYSVHTDMAHSVLRIKEDYDGAEPSPNSLAALNLVRLSAMLAKDSYRAQAEKLFALFGSTLEKSPSAVPVMAMAFELLHRGKTQIVLAGDKTAPELQKLAKHLHSQFLPHAVLLHADGGEAQKWLSEHNEALSGMKPLNGHPAAYLCQNFTCQAPVTTVEELEKLLSK
ncbi:MAG: thioredoxin domain-containing protein [Verrucomicrobiaceae bacterium]|nr:thioredoxin domain-containing protein [Verrucomicrobiaceae bacterium]